MGKGRALGFSFPSEFDSKEKKKTYAKYAKLRAPETREGALSRTNSRAALMLRGFIPTKQERCGGCLFCTFRLLLTISESFFVLSKPKIGPLRWKNNKSVIDSIYTFFQINQIFGFVCFAVTFFSEKVS